MLALGLNTDWSWLSCVWGQSDEQDFVNITLEHTGRCLALGQQSQLGPCFKGCLRRGQHSSTQPAASSGRAAEFLSCSGTTLKCSPAAFRRAQPARWGGAAYLGVVAGAASRSHAAGKASLVPSTLPVGVCCQCWQLGISWQQCPLTSVVLPTCLGAVSAQLTAGTGVAQRGLGGAPAAPDTCGRRSGAVTLGSWAGTAQ